MIESVIVSVAEKQGIVAILLVFFIVRSQSLFDRCLSRQNEVTTTLLLMVGDILCDKTDSEKCKLFEDYKTRVEAHMSSTNAPSRHKGIFSILQVSSSRRKKI